MNVTTLTSVTKATDVTKVTPTVVMLRAIKYDIQCNIISNILSIFQYKTKTIRVINYLYFGQAYNYNLKCQAQLDLTFQSDYISGWPED